jgi:hypothetical protein
VRNALADGKIDARELSELRALALNQVKLSLGQSGIDDISDVLKIGAKEVEPYLAGLIERALGNFLSPTVSNAPGAALAGPAA